MKTIDFMVGMRFSTEESKKNAADRGHWSGEATRLRGINDQTRVDIRIGDEAVAKQGSQVARERPIWMVESTIGHDGASVIYDFWNSC